MSFAKPAKLSMFMTVTRRVRLTSVLNPKPPQDTLTSFVRRDPNRVPQDVKSKLTDSRVDLRCLDMRPFDIVSGLVKDFTK